MGDRARHAPHDTGGFVLRDDVAAGGDEGLGALRAVRPHPGQHHGEDVGLPDLGRRGEQRIDRRLAEIDLRSVIESDDRIRTRARNAHMAAARSEIDLPCPDDLTIDRLVSSTAARARQMLGEGGVALERFNPEEKEQTE